MSGYRGFASKAEYEAYYSDFEQYKDELQSMEDYCKEAELERNVMPTETKACNLTQDEIECLIAYHGRALDLHSAIADNEIDDKVERINYLHKRLKTFREPEAKPEAGTAAATTVELNTAPAKWGA